MGKVESNGVYVGKSGYLMEEFKAPDQTQYDATVKAMTDFAQKHSDLKQYALIAPNSVNILSDRLPAFAPVQDQNSWLDSLSASLTDAGVTFIDVRSTFKDHKMDLSSVFRQRAALRLYSQRKAACRIRGIFLHSA